MPVLRSRTKFLDPGLRISYTVQCRVLTVDSVGVRNLLGVGSKPRGILKHFGTPSPIFAKHLRYCSLGRVGQKCIASRSGVDAPEGQDGENSGGQYAHVPVRFLHARVIYGEVDEDNT